MSSPKCWKCDRLILDGYEEQKGGGLSGPVHGHCPEFPDLEKLKGTILRYGDGEIIKRNVLIAAVDLQILLDAYGAALHVLAPAYVGPGLCLCPGSTNCEGSDGDDGCASVRRVMP